MRTTGDYLLAGAAHDAEFERRHAPWNQPDAEPSPIVCAWCWHECEDRVSDCGDVVCDQCLVDHAASCGEWSAECIAAARRLNVDPSTC